MGIGIRGDIPKIPQIIASDKISKAYRVPNAESVKGKKDEVTISEGAKDINMVTNILRDIPDVREEKVREISEMMEAGTYHVEDEEIAGKMVDYLNGNLG